MQVNTDTKPQFFKLKKSWETKEHFYTGKKHWKKHKKKSPFYTNEIMVCQEYYAFFCEENKFYNKLLLTIVSINLLDLRFDL